MLSRFFRFFGRVRAGVNHALNAPARACALDRRLDAFAFAQVEALRLALLADPKYLDPLRLTRHGFKAYSQYDEDGILDEVFRRVGTTNQYFVEFGVGDGLENNTAYRLAAGWRGLWIEGSASDMAVIRRTYAPLVAAGRLTAVEAFVTAEGIEGQFAAAGVPAECDLLSIDIDGNDYWVWRAITAYRPRVVVVEYNAGLGPTVPWAMPYRADFVYDRSRAYGASLKALEVLGRAKGYTLVGCGLSGVNAFFVRSDLAADLFHPAADAGTHFEPPRYYLLSFPGHPPSHVETAALVAGPPDPEASR